MGGTALPSTVGKFDVQFTEDSFCTCPLTTDGSGDATTVNGLLLSPVCTVLDAGTGGTTAFTAAVGRSDVMFTEESFCTCGLATDGSCGVATGDDLPLFPVCTSPASGCTTDGTDDRLGIAGGLFVLSPSCAAGVNSFEVLGGRGGDSDATEFKVSESSSASCEIWQDGDPRRPVVAKLVTSR